MDELCESAKRLYAAGRLTDEHIWKLAMKTLDDQKHFVAIIESGKESADMALGNSKLKPEFREWTKTDEALPEMNQGPTGKAREPILLPFTISIDTREQLPYRFEGFTADSKDRGKPLIVKAIAKTLRTGDYSIDGMENRFTIERKSIEDAYQTIVHGRERFLRELERMSKMEFAAVVIEAEESTLLRYVDQDTGGSVKSVYRCLRYWPIDYGVHFVFSGGRAMAERNVLRMCQRFWRKKDGNYM